MSIQDDASVIHRQLLTSHHWTADELVVELRDELRGAIADIRRLVYNLRPPALDDLGLVEALRRLVERHSSKDEPLSVVVEALGAFSNLPAAVEVAVYRVSCRRRSPTWRVTQLRRAARRQ